MFRYVLLLCAALAAVNAQTTEVSQCINNAGDVPINSYIEGCTTPPCMLYKGTYANINLIFKAPYIMHEMRTLATAYLILGLISVPVPYDLGSEALTCNFLTNTYCPVVTGEVIQYRLQMYIDPNFPSGTSVTIEFRVVDDNSVPILCIRVPVRLE